MPASLQSVNSRYTARLAKVIFLAQYLVKKLRCCHCTAAVRIPGFGIVTANTPQRAPLQKHHRAHTRPVQRAKALKGVYFPNHVSSLAMILRSTVPKKSNTFVERARNDLALLLARKLAEIHRIAGNTNGQVRIFLGVVVRFQERFAIHYIHIQMVRAV